jgi:DNA-binding MarR family transcriptional regulator
LLHFREHGKKAIEKVAKEQPASYLKILALLVPREHKIEHSNALKNLTDEQLDAMIEYLKASLEAQAQTAQAIEGESVPALPAPAAL